MELAGLNARAPRTPLPNRESFDVIVIGGGQAGLSVGYHLARAGVRFVILDANERIGDSWRKRWDSLRLFTPAKFDGLAGMPFPAPRNSFPTKDEMADYLEAYAARFRLPVRSGVRVERLFKRGARYVVKAGALELEADQVVVAMASYQRPKVPAFAAALSSEIVQMHSTDYRNLAQLQPGGVLIVGAGNSGAELAMETARGGHQTWIVGQGHRPRSVSTGGLPRPQPARAAAAPVRLPPAADGEHTARPEGATEGAGQGRAVDPRQAQGSRGGWHPAGPARRRRARRPDRCSRTAGRWTLRMSSGAAAFIPASTGSTFPSSATTASCSTRAAWSRASPDSTSSA